MLKLIINKNKDVLEHKILKEFKKDGYNIENILVQEEFLPIKTKGLFPSNNEAIWIDLTENENIKKFKKRIEKDDKIKKDILKQDVIIGLNTFRATQKLEKFVKDLNGEIIKEKELNIEQILSNYPINRSLIYNIKDFIGEDDEKILSFLNTLDQMTDDDIRNINERSVYSLLDPKPGSIPIYQFVNPVIEGNVKMAIDYFDRTVENIHPNACLGTLKNRVQLMSRANTLYNIGYNTPNKVANVLEAKAYPIKLMWHIVSNNNAVDRICFLVTKLEKELKGESKLDNYILFKRYLIEITLIARSVK